MKNQIININIFEIKVTYKTIWIFLKIENNHNLIGWGEATLSGQEDQVLKVKDNIFKIIRKRKYNNPYDIKPLLPFNNIVQSAISSSIMQALWDIQGKEENKNIASIFGKNRELIEVYANFNRSTIDRSIQGVKSKTKEILNQGYKFVKFAPFDEVDKVMNKNDIHMALDKGLERINVIRETLEKNTNILIDCHWRFNYETSLELIKQCDNFNLYWIECPITENEENIQYIKKIRSEANNRGIKLAGLEKKILKDGFIKFLKSGVYDVMMPDIKYAGGPDEMLEIEKLFYKFNVEFSPHNPSGPISHAHTLQVCSCTLIPSLMEHQYNETKYFYDLLEKPNPSITLGKSRTPNHIKGLGVCISEAKLTKLTKHLPKTIKEKKSRNN